MDNEQTPDPTTTEPGLKQRNATRAKAERVSALLMEIAEACVTDPELHKHVDQHALDTFNSLIRGREVLPERLGLLSDKHVVKLMHPSGTPEPYRWRSATVGYKRYLTDAQYHLSSYAVQRWYLPIMQAPAIANFGKLAVSAMVESPLGGVQKLSLVMTPDMVEPTVYLDDQRAGILPLRAFREMIAAFCPNVVHPSAAQAIEQELANNHYPANPKSAARCGYAACLRILSGEPVLGSVIPTLIESL